MRIYRLPERGNAPCEKARAAAHARASEQHPEASRIVILWTPANERGDFHAEVWHGKTAQVVAC
jgi:hypothetical protein